MMWNPKRVFRVDTARGFPRLVNTKTGHILGSDKRNTNRYFATEFQRRTISLDFGERDSEDRVKALFFNRMKQIKLDARKLAKPEIDRIRAEYNDHLKVMKLQDEWLGKRRIQHIKTLKDKGWPDREISIFILNDWEQRQTRMGKRVEELEVELDMVRDVKPVGDYMQNLLRKKFKWPSTRSKGKQYPSLKNKALNPEQKGNTIGEALVGCPNCSNTFIERIHEEWHKIKCPKCNFYFRPEDNLAGTY